MTKYSRFSAKISEIKAQKKLFDETPLLKIDDQLLAKVKASYTIIINPDVKQSDSQAIDNEKISSSDTSNDSLTYIGETNH